LATKLSSDRVILGFRPEAAYAGGTGDLGAEVYASDLHGAFNMLHLALEEENVEAVIHIRGERGHSHVIGEDMRFGLQPEMVRFFDPQSERAIVLEERS
jgi:ABC-type sugar transport system ATPase subunit